MRQLVRCDAALAAASAQSGLSATPLADLASMRGVVIQKSKPGRRRALKRYVE